MLAYIYHLSFSINAITLNGAYGGVSPTGEIVVNFYLERIPIPYEDTHELSNNGQIGELIKREPEDIGQSVIRYVQNGVILSLEQAKALHSWLGSNIKEAESLNKTVNKSIIDRE